ncbi:MAG: CCE_0567 family metalloprotein [Isosphaeraceae bacterium]|nr:CCE_0567 family metalloprotein [Isosphaeraceae bacterium]
MSTEERVRGLEKELQKRKRIAAEWAGRMHDLAEERLPEHFAEIAEIAEGTRNACMAWKEIADELKAAQAAAEVTAS